MRKFDDLYPSEQNNAMHQCIPYAIENIFDGLVTLDEIDLISEETMNRYIMPEAQRLACQAYYPDLNDIIVYIKDEK
jgi:hypothetical protein